MSSEPIECSAGTARRYHDEIPGRDRPSQLSSIGESVAFNRDAVGKRRDTGPWPNQDKNRDLSKWSGRRRCDGQRPQVANQSRSRVEVRSTFLDNVARGDWRRGRDLNPRGGLTPPTRLAGERLRPLGHLSKIRIVTLPADYIGWEFELPNSRQPDLIGLPRRGWDSNPRDPNWAQRFSRPSP